MPRPGPPSLVRGAALAGTGYPGPLANRAVAALSDPAWQVRSGASTALSAEAAAPAPAKAPADPTPTSARRRYWP